MDIHKPKAAHNWREFLVEIGTIICGILIALGLEQAIEAIHRGQEVAEARHALDAEIGVNLARFDYITAQSDCVNRRLDEVSRWSRSWDEGRPLRLLAPVTPAPYVTMGFRHSVWQVASGAAVAQMPFEARAGYGRVYDSVDYIREALRKMSDDWRDLSELSYRRELDKDQRRKIDFDIAALRSSFRELTEDSGLTQNAREVGVVKRRALSTSQGFIDRKKALVAAFCKPILAPEAS